MIAFASSLDQAGVIARTAEDARCCCNAMAGFDERDSTSVDTPVPDYVARSTAAARACASAC
jgi:aspartyl-tRNA(Asn)/glutamyl-tRNA(Gln) amidotransferase subunit A